MTEVIRAIRQEMLAERVMIRRKRTEPASELTLTSRENSEVLVNSYRWATQTNRSRGRWTIGAETAKSHVRNIIAKLGARDRTHAVTLGLHRGMIQFC